MSEYEGKYIKVKINSDGLTATEVNEFGQRKTNDKNTMILSKKKAVKVGSTVHVQSPPFINYIGVVEKIYTDEKPIQYQINGHCYEKSELKLIK